jgi:hypothetical protein
MHGQFVAIDVESGDFEIAGESASATGKRWERIPEAQIHIELS